MEQHLTKINICVLVVMLFTITLVSGANFGTYERDSCVLLTITCDNCTYVNITSIQYPNSSESVTNVAMTKADTKYTYSYCNTNPVGEYHVYTQGDDDGRMTTSEDWFFITNTGFSFDVAKSVYYSFLLFLLVFLLVLSLIAVTKLPNGNTTDEYGQLISVNHLKHLRPILYIIAWVILLAIIFTSSNIAMAYLPENMMGNLLFTVYKGMFVLTLPFLFFWFAVLLVNIFRDRETKNMIERGGNFQQI